jgi:hypothetical protein
LLHKGGGVEAETGGSHPRLKRSRIICGWTQNSAQAGIDRGFIAEHDPVEPVPRPTARPVAITQDRRNKVIESKRSPGSRERVQFERPGVAGVLDLRTLSNTRWVFSREIVEPVVGEQLDVAKDFDRSPKE